MPHTTLSQDQLRIIQYVSTAFVQRVQAAWEVARRPPVSVSSFWRSPDENARVGGEPASQHLIGTAVDVVGDTGPLRQAAQSLGLVAVPEVGHLHLQLFPAYLRAVEVIAPQLVRG